MLLKRRCRWHSPCVGLLLIASGRCSASAPPADSPPFRQIDFPLPGGHSDRRSGPPPEGVASADAFCSLVTPLLKVQPQDTVLRSPEPYRLTMARNEYESVQLICSGGASGLTNISVAVTLEDDAGAAGISYLLHSVQYYLAVNLSDCNSRQGYRPDPLIPEYDPWYGEARRMTSAIADAQSAGWWVDFFADKSTPAGTYTGYVTVAAAQLQDSSIVQRFSIRVRDLTLPDTSPSATAFLYWGWTGATETDMQQAVDLGLMHRITTSNILGWADGMLDPPDFGAFMSRWGEYLAGRALPFGLRNTTVTSLAMPGGYCRLFANGSCSQANLEKTVSYWRAVYSGFSERGYAHLLWDYSLDEPAAHPGSWAELVARHAVVKAVDENLRTTVTTTIDQAQANNATDLIDLWVPAINEVAVKGA